MNEVQGNRTPYATWHKVILVGCLLIALIGTVVVVGGMIKVSGTIKEYGGSLSAPFFVAFLMGLLSVWLFACTGGMLVYVAKTNRDIAELLRAGGTVRTE